MVDYLQEVHRYTGREIPKQFLTGFYLLSFSHTDPPAGQAIFMLLFFHPFPPCVIHLRLHALVLARSATRSSDEIISLDPR